MVDREPSQANPGDESDAAWAEVDNTAGEGISLDLDLNDAINETLATVQPQTVDVVQPVLVNQPSTDQTVGASKIQTPIAAKSGVAADVATVSPTVVSAAKASAAPVSAAPVATVKASATTVPAPNTSDPPDKAQRRELLLNRLGALRTMPSWLVSMMLHVAILMTLAAIQIEPVRDAIGIMMTAVSNEEAPGIEDSLEMDTPANDVPAAAASADSAMASNSDAVTSQEVALPDAGSLANPLEITVDVGKIGSVVDSVVPSSALNASAGRISSSLSGRGSGSIKSEMIEKFGGNAASEKSVALALQWLADHQDRSGGWTFAHSAVCRGKCEDEGDTPQAVNAATALALLPFLGAGQTHIDGKYKTTVQKGLTFLISRMEVSKGESPRGSMHEEGGSMYSHGLASIVFCEAYAMTHDPSLLQPAQLAVNYILYAQDPTGGGWRYAPKQPGDTSVVGWQLMALKSGVMGNLTVPSDTFRKANSFLDSMSVNDGAYYGYDQPTANIEGRQATTAVGLLCRMYLGWSKDRPGMKEGVKYLAQRGPDVNDLYYSYYATQVMRQYGGTEWEAWNKAMRDGLIKSQVNSGHAIGSWYSPGGHNIKGGRLYCTALSTMILEVYYRHMPLYSEKSSDEEFEF